MVKMGKLYRKNYGRYRSNRNNPFKTNCESFSTEDIPKIQKIVKSESIRIYHKKYEELDSKKQMKIRRRSLRIYNNCD